MSRLSACRSAPPSSPPCGLGSKKWQRWNYRFVKKKFNYLLRKSKIKNMVCNIVVISKFHLGCIYDIGECDIQ